MIGSRSTNASAETAISGGGVPIAVRRAPSGPAPNFLARLLELFGDAGPAQGRVAKQRVEAAPLLGQRRVLAPDFHFLQPPQAAQAHVEDRLGLCVATA